MPIRQASARPAEYQRKKFQNVDSDLPGDYAASFNYILGNRPTIYKYN